MPRELLQAHRDNDEAVEGCYGARRFRSDLERLAYFLTSTAKTLTRIAEKETRKAKRRPSQK